MAKKKELTVEEKLAEALVREDEQPYGVPGNWVWVFGKNLFEPMTSKKPNGEYFEYIDIDAIDNQTQQVQKPKLVLSSKAPSRARRSLKCGDVLFSLVRPYLKNIAYIDESLEQCIASTGFFVCRPTKIINGRYLYYLMTSELVVCGLNKFMKGDNSPSIRKDDIEEFSFPLPPLAEQQRIVDRIESLFDQLDQAKALIQEALDSFETRKAASLHQAFTGALTKKWREAHGVGIESWVKYPLSEICTLKSGTTIPPEEELSIGKIPYIKVAEMNLEENQFSITTSIRYVNECAESKLIPLGSIIFPKRGGAIFTNKKRILLNTPIIADLNIMAIIPDKNYLTSLYAYFWFLTVNLKELNNGSNVPQINNKDMVNLIIPTPSILEQQEIVRLLDDLFEKEQAAFDLCDQIDQIDTIKKTILGKAFRGELGTNVAGEESALALLKKVLQGKEK